MVITKLIGGLGNQMFQYAAALALSIRLRTEMKIDLTRFASYPLRTFELECYNIKTFTASEADIARLTSPSNLWGRLVGFRKNHILQEKHFHVDPRFYCWRGDCYLDGYWQSERYFLEQEDVIRHCFSWKNSIISACEELRRDIEAKTAVSIHVRRGDYVSSYETNAFHGTCSIEYYHEAAKLVACQVRSPHYFIFSDDICWAKDNLHLPFPTTFMSDRSLHHASVDMLLMSYCQHHIIANSSYSWWGAWLCSNPEKIVIAPKKWFNDSTIDTSDLIPQGWQRI